MDILIDWDQIREMHSYLLENKEGEKKKNLWHTTNVTISITI